jgi:D-alanine transaminase
VKQISQELIKRNGLESGNALVYFQVTRGVAPRVHGFPKDVPPSVYGYAAPLVPRFDPEVGVAAVTVPDTRWARCDIKVVSMVANCLANQQALDEGAFEALFVRDGAVLEGTHTSMFAIVDGEVRTAPLTNYILPGITRNIVVELCRAAGLPIRETPVLLNQFRRADEVFLAGTTAEVLPVVRVDGKVVGNGKPGPLTTRIRSLFTKETQRGAD